MIPRPPPGPPWSLGLLLVAALALVLAFWAVATASTYGQACAW